MASAATRRSLCYGLVAVILLSPMMLRAQSAAQPSADAAAAMAQYRQALDEYNRARQVYAAVAGAYWASISEKRKARNAKRARGEPLVLEDYVLDQPPVYTGPPKPHNPLQEVPSRPVYVPVVAD